MAEAPRLPPPPPAEAVVVDTDLNRPDSELRRKPGDLALAVPAPKPVAADPDRLPAGTASGPEPTTIKAPDPTAGDIVSTKAGTKQPPQFKAEPSQDAPAGVDRSVAVGDEEASPRRRPRIESSEDPERRTARPKKARQLNRSARRNQNEGKDVAQKKADANAKVPKEQAPPRELLKTIGALGAVGRLAKAHLSVADTIRGPRLVMERNTSQGILPISSAWDVRVEGGLARVEAEYVFESFKDSGRAVFSHPLAADAVVLDMGVWDGAQRPDTPKNKLGNLQQKKGGKSSAWVARSHSQVLARKQARQIFQESLPLNDGAAQLAVGSGPSFTIDISGVVPGRPLKVLFVWQVPLTPSSEGSVLQLSIPAEGITTKLSAHVDMAPASVVAPGWKAEASSKQWCTFSASASPGGQLRLVVKGDATRFGPVEQGLYERAFVTRLRPHIESSRASPTGKAIFVVDTSRSVAHPASAALRAQTLRALLKDPTLESYVVLLFDVHARWLHGPSWREPSADNVQDTLTQLARVELEGATDLDSAFAALDTQWIREAGPSHVFFLSDANATWGSQSAEVALERHPHLRAHRWVSYRFAGAPDRAQILRGLAEATAGRVVTVAGHDEVAAAAEAHKHEGARLLSLKVAGGKHVVVVGDPVGLHAGQTLTVFGRAEPGAHLELTFEENGKRRVQRLVLGDRQSSLVPVSWAAALVDSWPASTASTVGDDAYRTLGLELAQHYRFAHEGAAFILANVGGTTAVRIRTLAQGLLRLRETRPTSTFARSKLSKEVQLTLRELRIRSDSSVQPQAALNWMPRAGGATRQQAELEYALLRDEPAFAPHFRMARTRAAVGDTLGAVRAVSTVAELAPLDAEGLRATAYALIGLGRPMTAVKVFQAVEKLQGADSRLLLDLGIAYESAGKIAKAAELWELGLHNADSFGEVFARLLQPAYAAAAVDGMPALAERQRWLARRFPASPLQLTALVSNADVALDLVVVRGGSVCRAARCDHGARVEVRGQGVIGYLGDLPRGAGMDVLVEHRGGGTWAPHDAAFVFLVERRGARLRHSMRLLEQKGQAWLLTTLKPQ